VNPRAGLDFSEKNTALHDKNIQPFLSYSRNFFRFMENEAYYRAYKSPLFVPTLTEAKHFHILFFYFYQISFIIKIPHRRKHSKCSLSFTFPHQNSLCISLLLHICHMFLPTHPYKFDLLKFGLGHN
jgi:hypothetical protein